jgi:alkylation response protein AidB-like acyl-CoA dehydrogenase
VLKVGGPSLERPADRRAPEAYEGPDGIGRFRGDLVAWLDDHASELQLGRDGDSLSDEVARTRRNQRRLWNAGWLRYGWPPAVGGFGGSPILRAAVAEEATARELFFLTLFAVTEVLVPTTISVAPKLAEGYAQAFLDGSEGWCQGFSEPDAGSDLAALRCRAVDKGDHWLVNGQKIWTSYAQFASRIIVLVRTGSPESRHRGISALLVDTDSPGVTIRPLGGINGHDEFSETFFDDVSVPKDRLVGEVNGGWGVAMSMLRSERGAIFWMLSTWLLGELHHLLARAELGPSDDERIGHAFASIMALRSRSWTTQHRMSLDTISIPETSIDKILMATSEQEFFDIARETLGGLIEFGEGEAARRWRSAYMYSRAASIYGGAAEIQRNIVADQVLGLRGLT